MEISGARWIAAFCVAGAGQVSFTSEIAFTSAGEIVTTSLSRRSSGDFFRLSRDEPAILAISPSDVRAK